jgi:hypothetical protein
VQAGQLPQPSPGRQLSTAPLSGPGLTTPEPTKSQNQYRDSFTSNLKVAVPPAPDPDARRALERITAARAAQLAEQWCARRGQARL